MAVASPVNTYAAGNCTWWVRQNAGWIPNGLGNAAEWLTNARARGLQTTQTPQVGAVAAWGPGVDPPLGFGHVALVTAVRPDGSFTVSEMNWKGLGVVDTRNVSDRANLQGFILPPGAAAQPSSGSGALTGNPIADAISGGLPQLRFGAQALAGGLVILVGVAAAVLIVMGRRG
jgi:CHAP domain